MRDTLYLTKGYSDIVEHQIRATRPGMAHFANTGPFGTVCGECAYWGYFKTRRTTAGDAVKTKHVSACAKYRELTNKHGPVVPANTPSCRHFVRREGDQS
jgi:hypothetical protein